VQATQGAGNFHPDKGCSDREPSATAPFDNSDLDCRFFLIPSEGELQRQASGSRKEHQSYSQLWAEDRGSPERGTG
jgi:hypothetical protein